MEATDRYGSIPERSHREYYSQYVTDEIRETVRASKITLDDKVKVWDKLGLLNRHIFRGVDTQMRLNGDWLTQAGIVCILKEAKRQLMEEEDECKIR